MDHVLFLMAKNGRNLWSPISAGEVHCFLDHLDPVQWVQVLESEIMFQHRMFSSLNRHILTYIRSKSSLILPLGLSRINRPEVVSHLRARSVSYRF